MKIRTLKKFIMVVVAAIILASCANVKEYQKSRINDSEMFLEIVK